ncbi:MAG: alpha-L-fucosidase [Planctomycetota bacterium]|jgi:alpha-L-fucosidase
MNRSTWLSLVALTLLLSAAVSAEPFDASWESLKRYQCPEWFRDAKLGIFVCWNLNSLQGVNDWYGFYMYREGNEVYKHHVKTYGHPSKFGYKDFIPLWRAENFDADDLVRQFKNAGAKYIVPIATFHDNFDCWNSKHHKWNSYRMGPKKDIIGLWKKACERHDLRFGVTTHLARSWGWLQYAHGADKEGEFRGVPYDGAGPKYHDFYHPTHGKPSRAYPVDAPQAWKDQWAARIKDLCDQHRPDLLYFDGGLPFPDNDGLTGREVVAWYYNQNTRWHNGVNEAVLNIKKWPPETNHGPFRAGMCVRDMEKGLLDGIQEAPWQNDTTVSAWFYQQNKPVRSVNSVVDMLAPNEMRAGLRTE